MLSTSPEKSNQLFAAIDADKSDDTDQNHCTGGSEADDIFQIFRAIFFETHFFCLHSQCFFQPRNLRYVYNPFLRQAEMRVRVVFFIPSSEEKSTLKFCGNRGDSHSILYAGVAAEDPPSGRKRLLSRGKQRSCPDGEREC